jgi:hypothetical protein
MIPAIILGDASFQLLRTAKLFAVNLTAASQVFRLSHAECPGFATLINLRILPEGWQKLRK